MKLIVFLALAMGLVTCKNPIQMNIDYLLKNAKIYTLDEQFSVAECMAIDDGKVVATGNFDDLNRKYRAGSIIDGRGKFIYPGFNDAHSHFFNYGINLLQYVDLSGSRSQEEIYERLQQHNSKNKGEWLLGRGWDQNDWVNNQFPDKTRLDKLFPNVPVYLIRIDGHAGWCNSKALELAGITADTKIEGGEVLVNNGEPTGLLIDKAESLVASLVPQLTDEQKKQALLLAQQNCFEVGLTSVADCGLAKQAILLIDKIQQEGKLKMRINAMLEPTDETLSYFLKTGPQKNDFLHVNTIKLYADGALGSRGALLLDDYSDDPGNRGLQVNSTEFLKRVCQQAYDNEFQVATHAIGDGANRLVLSIYSEILREKNDRRWRIEHAQIIQPEDIQMFGDFSIIPSIQATHAISDMYWVEKRLGSERMKGAYAYQDLLQQNGWLPNGTDFPVEDISPLKTFCAAVFRQDEKGYPKQGFQSENALTREQALRSITIWAARSSFEENEKGSLEPGKWADFVLLDKDLLKANRQTILNAKVLETWLGGEKVFSRK